MPEYDDSKFIRKTWTPKGRDVVSEIEDHASDRTQNFLWGRVALVAVPAAAMFAGVWFIADTTLGERERVDTAPKAPLAELERQLRDSHTKHFHYLKKDGDHIAFPHYVEVSGFATLSAKEEISGTNGAVILRTYRFSENPVPPSQASFQVVTDTNGTVSTNLVNTNGEWPVYIQTKIAADSPFDPPIGDRQGPVPVTVIVGIKDSQLTRSTNGATFRVVQFRDPE